MKASTSDPMNRPLTRARARSGVPIGGLGTGSFEVRADGRLHDWLGYSRDEVIGKNMLTLPCFPWRSKLRIMRKFTQRMVGRDLPPYDVTFTGKDGKYYYGRVQAAPIRNEKGRIISDLVMISNITDQVRAEQALQESEQKLIKAQEIAHLGYWEYDIENDHIIWSPELYRIYGVESDNRSLTHSVLQSLIHPEDQAYHDDVTNRMKDDGSAEFEFRVRRADGTVRYISGKGEASYDADGTPRRLFGVIQDITERRENEEARFRLEANLLQAQKLESLGVLAGGIAHDFNNLLMAIMGNAELARADIPRDSPAQKGLVEIDSISRDAADLCKQMLAYSGRGQFYVHPLNLTEVIESMAHLLNVSVEKNAIIKSELDPTVPSIEGDSSQIRQLVMNLITNASEAMGKKVGTITLRTGVRHVSRSYLKTIAMDKNLPEGDCVFVEVVDGGDGISSEVQQRMFDPFFSTKFTGRGLGLAAVLGIARSHYGAIDVKSTPGKGTSVTVLFPKTDAPASPEGQAPLPRIKKDTPSPSRAQTILVVDDEQAVLSVTGQILSRAGYAVRAAASGADALAVVQKYGDTLGAVVLDLAMPQMSGLEALKQIRDVLPTIPVIVASGYSEEEAAEELAGNTITAFLPKPFSADALLKHIADALG